MFSQDFDGTSRMSIRSGVLRMWRCMQGIVTLRLEVLEQPQVILVMGLKDTRPMMESAREQAVGTSGRRH